MVSFDQNSKGITNQRYFQQTDVKWVCTGYPEAGNLTCFNNGISLDSLFIV